MFPALGCSIDFLGHSLPRSLSSGLMKLVFNTEPYSQQGLVQETNKRKRHLFLLLLLKYYFSGTVFATLFTRLCESQVSTLTLRSNASFSSHDCALFIRS